MLLRDFPITHGGVKPVQHPRLHTQVNGQTAIRYLRFGQRARIDFLELAPNVYGRWVPNVPTHPAHLLISVLDESSGEWRLMREVDLPYDPRIAGEGLTQSMGVEAMNEHFAAVMKSPPHRIDLGGLEIDHLRVECDREHPVWPSHGECNGGEFNVPFGILNTLSAHGQPLTDLATPAHLPPLSVAGLAPAAPQGASIVRRPDMLLFESDRLSVGFSLIRPMLMHLGWDAHAQGRASQSRLLASRTMGRLGAMGGLSGPLLRQHDGDWGAQQWTGEVEVRGNRVEYRNLRAIDGLTIDATFVVERERLILELVQRCDQAVPVIEAEAWRLAWDLSRGITGAMALPTLRPGRNGDAQLPALWATDSVGCLAVSVVEGAPLLQVESYRTQTAVTGGFTLGTRPTASGCLSLPQGEQRATIEFKVSEVAPAKFTSASLGRGAASRWASIFACFRPEYGGFSNNAASVNCHVSQAAPFDLVTRTQRPSHGPDPIDLARFTVERALLDGGGYGYWRNLYMDADPNLVCAAGRVFSSRPDVGWLRRVEPGLVEVVERMLGTLGEQGLVICRDLSGDSGSYRWSSNAMDVVGFGHIDAYVNAWSYRAFRNAAGLMARLGRTELAEAAQTGADRIRAAYAPALLNPDTGWIAGWRSRDGQLHDYAFLYVNGVALAFGLVEHELARRALLNLEALRARVGPGSARLGLPCNLLPIRAEDHMLPSVVSDFGPTFETYTDGSVSGWPAAYYLRALSIHGLRDQARQLAQELDEGYAAGAFDGGMGTGHEFRSWEGLPTGYEGTLIGCFAPLYAIAIEQGVIEPEEPEWWPTGQY